MHQLQGRKIVRHFPSAQGSALQSTHANERLPPDFGNPGDIPRRAEAGVLSLYTVGYKSTGAMRGTLNQYLGDESIDFFKLNTPHANLIVAKS